MLIRLFFGIPLPKHLQKERIPSPAVTAIFQNKKYVGIYTCMDSAIEVAQLETYYSQAKEIIASITDPISEPDLESSLVVFPEVLIGI